MRPCPTMTIGWGHIDVGNLRIPRAEVGDAQPVHQIRRELAGGDLRTELGERGLGRQRVGESIEPFLPRVLAEVVEARRLGCVGDDAGGVERSTHG